MSKKRKADPEKIKKILADRGYKGGEAPRDYQVHHIKPVAGGGKDIPKNIRVIPTKKHQQIHANRKKQGKI